MKRQLPVFVLLMAMSCAYATKTTIVNHFNKPLTFIINNKSAPKVLVDLPSEFKLDTSNKIESAALDTGHDYIRVEDSDKNYAFWGIEVVHNQVVFHGYLSKEIAYSWNGQTITFCTSADYKAKSHC